MPPRRTPEQIIADEAAEIAKERERLEAKIKKLELRRNKLQAKERKLNTRRHILMGLFCAARFEQQDFALLTPSHFRLELLSWLTKDSDKALFDDDYWANLTFKK